MTAARHGSVTQASSLEGDDVWVTIPPYSEYLRTVRLVAADAAGRAGLDCDEIEDFRIAVDELTHLLMTATDHEIAISFGVVGSSVMSRGRARRRQGAAPRQLDDLSRTIIGSVADSFETTDNGVEVAFSVMKRRSTSAAHP